MYIKTVKLVGTVTTEQHLACSWSVMDTKQHCDYKSVRIMYLSQNTKQENVYIVIQNMRFNNYDYNFSIDKDITNIFEFTVRHSKLRGF